MKDIKQLDKHDLRGWILKLIYDYSFNVRSISEDLGLEVLVQYEVGNKYKIDFYWASGYYEGRNGEENSNRDEHECILVNDNATVRHFEDQVFNVLSTVAECKYEPIYKVA
jgi:hypothetical protein